VAQNCCDVLIVGGGPAGLAAAIALRMSGADVVVADALQPPIDKACGEGLMPDSLRDLAALGIELSPHDGASFSGIRFVNWTDASGANVSAEFATGHGLGVRRTVLHSQLVQRAAELGVRMKWRTHVALGAKQVTLNSEACSYRYVVGADGQSSRVRTWAGLDSGSMISRRFGFRRHFHTPSWNRSGDAFVEVHWGSMGQVYITPVTQDQICIAAVTRHNNVRMQQVVDTIPFLRERLASAKPLERERGAITTTRKLKRVVRGNVALLGDASGSVDAVTGEGLAVSFRQAALLRRAIERENLVEYAEAHQSTLRLPQRMSRLMLLMDKYPALRNRVMRALASSPEIFRHMLDVHMGEMAILRFLLCHGPEISLRLAFSPAVRI
jgi:flavin-dependent dehydrogenase